MTGAGEAALALRAPIGDVEDLARRLRMMLPGGARLNPTEALTLAQAAVAHGLDPFNGEIWFLPGRGLMIGIKGLRKAARAQIRGNYWLELTPITDEAERARLEIPEGALAVRCVLRDSETLRAYSAAWGELAAAGVPAERIPDLLGERPFTPGLGIFRRGEASKMDPAQVAAKRAEADAIKRRFSLPFATSAAADDVAEPIEALEQPRPGPDETIEAEVREEPAPGRPLDPERLRDFLHQRAAQYQRAGVEATAGERGAVVGGLELLFAGEPDSTARRHALVDFFFGCASTKALDGGQVLALRDWIGAQRDSGGAWVPAAEAIAEAQLVIAHLEAGAPGAEGEPS